MQYWHYPAATFGFCVFIALLDIVLIRRRGMQVDAADRKRLGSILQVGAVLAAIAWVVQWSTS